MPKKVVESRKKEVLLQFGLPHHDVLLAVLKRVLHRRKRGNKFSLLFAGIFQRNYRIYYDDGGLGSFTDISSSVSFSNIIAQRFRQKPQRLLDYCKGIVNCDCELIISLYRERFYVWSANYLGVVQIE